MRQFRQPIKPGVRVLWDEKAGSLLFFGEPSEHDDGAIRRANGDSKYLAELIVTELDFLNFVVLLSELHELDVEKVEGLYPTYRFK